jgi:hypothetical protein
MDEQAVIRAQALYYGATGVWPILSPKSFQAVTGPKTDMWLVKTFGVLVGAVGLGLGAGARDTVSSETRVLAAGTALSLAAADVWYAARGRIAKTYLIDAVAQIALLAALAAADSDSSGS